VCGETATTICGTYGTWTDFFGFPYRDTDWYRFVLTAQTNVHVEVTGEACTQWTLNSGAAGCPETILNFFGSGPGKTASFDGLLSAGTYYIVVTTRDFAGVACGSRYTLSESCHAPVPVKSTSWGSLKATYR